MADLRTLQDYNAIAYMADRYGRFTPDVNSKIIRWAQNEDVFYTKAGKRFINRLYDINDDVDFQDNCVICGRRARNWVVCNRCIDDFIEIDESMADDYYEPARRQQRSNDYQRQSAHGRRKSEIGPKWASGKLIIGIISIMLFMFISFQSCAAGLVNAVSSNGESSGSFGFMCALLMLVAGITGIIVRKNGTKPNVVVAVIYYLAFLIASVGAGSYSDLKIWGIVSFIFGAVYLFSVIDSDNMIKAAIPSLVLFIVCVILMLTGSGKNKNKVQTDSLSDMTVTGDAGTTQNNDIAGNGTVVQETSSGAIPSIQEAVLLDNSGVMVKAVEMVDDTIFGPALKLYIENNSDKNVVVGCDALIVNDYMITDLFSATVSPGMKSNETLNLLASELSAAGIEKIGKIEIYFKLIDPDTWQEIYKSECVTLQTSDFAYMDTVPNDVGKEILNQEGLKIVAKYVDENSFWGKSILLYVENTSGRKLCVQVDNMSINGYMIQPIFSSIVYPGKKAISDITLLQSDLDMNGITSVDDVALTFNVFDPETFENVFTTEAISFSTH